MRLKDCAGAQAKDADFLFKVIKNEVFSKAESNPKDCMQVCATLVLLVSFLSSSSLSIFKRHLLLFR